MGQECLRQESDYISQLEKNILRIFKEIIYSERQIYVFTFLMEALRHI